MESEETPQYRMLNPDELEVLRSHHSWLAVPGKEKQANFTGHDFRKVDFSKRNLRKSILVAGDFRGAIFYEANLEEAGINEGKFQKAQLVRANLKKAILTQANFQEADLTQADLSHAQLAHVNFRDAILQDSDFTDAKGLFAKQLAGSNVAGAKLPEDIHKFEGVAHVKDLSQRAQKLFLTLLLGCVYCWLTIGTTTDLGLITDSVSSPLPIIGTNIRISGFYFAAPWILFGIYIWFHLYLQNLWKELSHLPATFPDGKDLDEKIDPWLVNGLVRAHLPLLKTHRPFLSKLQVGLSIILIWWVVPFTLVLLWGAFLTKHDWLITGLHILLIEVVPFI